MPPRTQTINGPEGPTSKQPQTPTKATKKTSRLAESPQASPRKAPAGLAKRMLSRNRTDSDLREMRTSVFSPDSPSEGNLRHEQDPFSANTSPGRTVSLPSIPSPSKGKSASPSKAIDQESNAAQSNLVRPSARTYSKSRSFLVELPASAADELLTESQELKESYKDLRTRWGVDASDVSSLYLVCSIFTNFHFRMTPMALSFQMTCAVSRKCETRGKTEDSLMILATCLRGSTQRPHFR